MLKSATGLVAVNGVITVGAADSSNDSFKDHIRTANQILESDEYSREDREKYLNKYNITGEGDRHTFVVDKKEESKEGELSTQSFAKYHLDIEVRLWSNCPDGDYYAELIWEYDWPYHQGEMPRDRVAIGYENQWWDLESYSIRETTETSTYVSPKEEEFGDGPCFTARDEYGDNQNQHYAGAYIEPVGNYGTRERRIQGAYTHVWNDISIESVSVGYPLGISVSVSDEDYKWRTRTERHGDELLRIAQADATYCS